MNRVGRPGTVLLSNDLLGEVQQCALVLAAYLVASTGVAAEVLQRRDLTSRCEGEQK